MDLVGDIIEESLEDRTILQRLTIKATRIEKVTAAHRTPWLSRWTLHQVVIPEDQTQAVAEELSGCLDRRHGGSWYVDFKNEEIHYVIYPNKVFRIDRRQKALYETVRQHGLALGIPEDQLVSWT